MFRFVLPGFNVRPLELSAAVGIEQLKRLPKIIIERRKCKIIKEMHEKSPRYNFTKEIGESSWFGLVF